MKRRIFVAGMVGFSAGGIALGTGAFRSVEADRYVSVETAGDGDAYLQFNYGSGVSDISEQLTEDDGDKLAVDINSLGTDYGDGHGTNLGAITTYDELFEVTNAGANSDTLYLWAEFPDDDSSLDDVYFYPEKEDQKRLEEDEYVIELATGESVTIGIATDTTGSDELDDDDDPYNPDDKLTIYAETDEPGSADTYKPT